MVVGVLINIVGYLACLIVGLGYPALHTIQAIESKSTADDTQWLTYWLLYSVYTMIESVIYPFFFKYIPFYPVFKALFLAWLVLPQFKGAAYVYEAAMLPIYHQVQKLSKKHPALENMLSDKRAAVKVTSE